MSAGLRIAAGLDAGSTRTRCAISVLEDDTLRYVAHAEAPSQGWTKGRISDPVALSSVIRFVAAEAERRAGTVLESVTVGCGGPGVEGNNSRAVYELGRAREIEAGDMQYAMELASRARLHEDRVVLQVAPQDFTVDGRARQRNPRGMMASRLEGHVHIITAPAQEHAQLVSTVHQSALAVEETVFEAAAAAYACVMAEDRSRGVALINIGSESTNLVVYDGDAMLRASSIPIAADHLTRDVAFGLTVSHDDAESLKREYGCAILGLTSDNSYIEVPSHDGRPAREASRKMLNTILEARAEELFLYVRNELARLHMDVQLLEGMVLTGGGALLNGMCDVAERVVNAPARNGLPAGILNWPEELNDPAWCVAAGLTMYSAKLKTRREWKRPAPGFLSVMKG